MTHAYNTGFDPITINGLLATQWLMSEAAETETEKVEEEVEIESEENEDDEEGEEVEEEGDEN